MKKSLIRILQLTMITLSCIAMAFLCSCSKGTGQSSSSGTMSLGGKEYPAIFVESGYYFDKASLSETVLADQLSKVREIKKPSSLGNIEMPDLKTIELTKQEIPNVDSAMIEAELEKELDSEVSYAPIKTKREAKLKDKVIIDFKGLINGEEFEGGSMEDCPLVLGSGQFIPGFEEQVVGHSAGKRFKIDLVFPTDYDPSLAGKPVQFEIVIKSIEEPSAPVVNDEFVRKHSRTGSTTVDQYKEEVKKRIEKRYEFSNSQLIFRQLFNALYEKTIVEPSEEALAWQFSAYFDQINKRAEQNGTNIMTIATSNRQTVRSVYDEIKSQIPDIVKETMICDEIKKKYGKEAKETDLMSWFDNMADAYGLGTEATYQDYVKEVGLDIIKEQVEIESAFLNASKECNFIDGEPEK